MHKQRWIDCTFAAMVKLVEAGRVARASAPACACALATALLVNSSQSKQGEGIFAADPAVSWLDSLQLAMRWTPDHAADAYRFGTWHLDPLHAPVPEMGHDVEPAADAAPEEGDRAGDAAPAPSPSDAHETIARPSPKLSPEQHNIVRFIARTHRIALDAAQDYVHYAFKSAQQHKLDPLLILAVMSIESNFNPRAQSHAGAQGLMQVLTRVHAQRFAPYGGTAAAFDPLPNILVGSTILKEYLHREGNVRGALKAYVGAALLPNDRGYGDKVLAARTRIAAAAAGDAAPGDAPTLTAAGRVLERTTRVDPDRVARGSSEI